MTGERTSATRLIIEANRPRAIVHRRCRLEVVRGPDKGTSVDVDRSRIRLGTGAANDLVLTDRSVSRLHAEIELGEEGYRLRDLGSTNGTRIGQLRVQDVFMEPGTLLTLGHTEVRFDAAGDGAVTELDPEASFGRLVGDSVPMRTLYATLRRVAPTDVTVLLVGETGTGKDLAAEAILDASPRRDGPFVVVDCSSLMPTLVEAELFGHEQGAFTGATEARTGAFERADGGTIFLDEIGELPLDMQPKLLRVLESRQVRRIGAARPLSIDVRVIAATNRSLAAEVNRGTFRADLYYRLAVVELQMPPLRVRKGDIPLLVARMLEDAGHDPSELSQETIDELGRYAWPGNVRELRNFLERAVALADAAQSPEAMSAARSAAAPPVDPGEPFRTAKERATGAFERAYVEAILTRSGGNVARAARDAQMDRMYLHKLAQRYGLLRPRRAKR
ncbi:MAG: sigma 54-dependent Fis family transcriptional regulator [Deltaproteobacteria bacterium]|nr:sigma 54-dependent Fis family transcriptional regulator [Deltaproteobacteria bacterium]